MKAILIGATGLVGSKILQLLLEAQDVEEVQVFSRRKLPFEDPKLKVDIVDFDRIQDWSPKVSGDVLFSALGTTLKAAGSQEAQSRVDLNYQYEVAQAAKQNGVDCCVLISSMGADSKSPFFYLKMKGSLEDQIRLLKFHRTRILRPGPLTGHREHPRLSEQISTSLLKALPTFLVPTRLQPVSGEKVAKVCLQAAADPTPGVIIYQAEQIVS